MEYTKSSHWPYHSKIARGVFAQLGPDSKALHRKPDFRIHSCSRSDLVLIVAPIPFRAVIACAKSTCHLSPTVSCIGCLTVLTSTLMSFVSVSHAVVARSPMDPDTAHTFSESSRNTLIATAAVGKSVQCCSFNPPRSPSLSPTWMHCSGSSQTMPLRSHAYIIELS